MTLSPQPMSLIMLDVDYFKQFNDTYGHVCGDDCLRGVAQVFGACIRGRGRGRGQGNLSARYGGEEFACILPGMDYREAFAVAEQLRQRVMALKIPHKASSAANVVSASMGVITVDCTPGLMPQKVIQHCDHQLYRAKKAGRNRVIGVDRRKSSIKSEGSRQAASL